MRLQVLTVDKGCDLNISPALARVSASLAPSIEQAYLGESDRAGLTTAREVNSPPHFEIHLTATSDSDIQMKHVQTSWHYFQASNSSIILLVTATMQSITGDKIPKKLPIIHWLGSVRDPAGAAAVSK